MSDLLAAFQYYRDAKIKAAEIVRNQQSHQGNVLDWNEWAKAVQHTYLWLLGERDMPWPELSDQELAQIRAANEAEEGGDDGR